MSDLNFEQRTNDDIAEFRYLNYLPTDSPIDASVTRMYKGSSPDLLTGNVLRRLCAAGSTACAQVCQAANNFNDYERLCADRNLSSALEKLVPDGITTLMIGVTADNVGFADQITAYELEGKVSKNSQGITEILGFNAFFTKESEDFALGARLADCGFVQILFNTELGEEVYGMVHLTRTSMVGIGHEKNNIDGKPTSALDYYLRTALKHYGGDENSVQLGLVANVATEDFQFSFKPKNKDGQTLSPQEVMDEYFPGWGDMGFMINSSNPDWHYGDVINPDDVFTPDYSAMVLYQITTAPGILTNKFERPINAGNINSGHASNTIAARGIRPDGRDLYLVSPKKAFDAKN